MHPLVNKKDHQIVRKKVHRKWRWTIAIVYTLTIYAFLPFGPGVWLSLMRYGGTKLNYSGIILVFLLGAYFLFHLIFQKKTKIISVYVIFFFISLACIALLKYMCVNGAERFHLLLYGVLSVIVFWALKPDIKSNRIYLYTILLVFLIGAVDEFIQRLLPMRFFDVRDIFMNWISSGLGMLFLVYVLRPDLKDTLENVSVS